MNGRRMRPRLSLPFWKPQSRVLLATPMPRNKEKPPQGVKRSSWKSLHITDRVPGGCRMKGKDVLGTGHVGVRSHSVHCPGLPCRPLSSRQTEAREKGARQPTSQAAFAWEVPATPRTSCGAEGREGGATGRMWSQSQNSGEVSDPQSSGKCPLDGLLRRGPCGVRAAGSQPSRPWCWPQAARPHCPLPSVLSLQPLEVGLSSKSPASHLDNLRPGDSLDGRARIREANSRFLR